MIRSVGMAMASVTDIGKAVKARKGAAMPVPAQGARKARAKVPQPDKRPDLSGAVTARVRDVIDYSDLSRSQIWKLEKDGRLKVVRIGRTVLVRMDSVLAVLGGPPAWVQQ
jgi:hypothetical protein